MQEKKDGAVKEAAPLGNRTITNTPYRAVMVEKITTREQDKSASTRAMSDNSGPEKPKTSMVTKIIATVAAVAVVATAAVISYNDKNDDK